MKYKIYTLGCKVNQYDGGNLSRKLEAAGFDFVETDADLAIINTCAVTKTAIRKGRRMIVKARRENPGAKIVLAGCFPRVYEEDWGVDLVVNDREVEDIFEKILNFEFRISDKIKNKKSARNASASEAGGLEIINSDKAKYFLKVQDGCEQFCTYCIIPYTRGKLRSRDEKEIIAEFKAVIDAGFKEVILCGIHLGLFGQGVESRKLKVESDLVSLLRKLITVQRQGRIRLSSIEVNEVSEDLIKLMAGEDSFCNHLHIPLQGGCDKILKLMNRPYDKKIFENKVKQIRKLIPDVAITTDVIVGFPGETEKDFKETYDFIKQIGFSKLHVFPFSAHDKTPAAKMANQVDRKVALNRAEKLRKLGEKLENDFKKKFVGKEVEILVEQINTSTGSAQGECFGKSGEYFDVKTRKELIETKRTKGVKVGDIVKVVFRG